MRCGHKAAAVSTISRPSRATSGGESFASLPPVASRKLSSIVAFFFNFLFIYSSLLPEKISIECYLVRAKYINWGRRCEWVLSFQTGSTVRHTCIKCRAMYIFIRAYTLTGRNLWPFTSMAIRPLKKKRRGFEFSQDLLDDFSRSNATEGFLVFYTWLMVSIFVSSTVEKIENLL